MTSDAFASYAQDVKDKADAWLGCLVWFTIEVTTHVPYDRMVEMLDEVGLDDAAPRPPKDDDVFRRACTLAESKRNPVPGTDKYENRLVRDVVKEGGFVWKHIVIETVDGNNKRLRFEPVLEVRFNPETSVIETEPLKNRVPNGAWETEARIRNEFDHWKGAVHDYAVRSLFRDVVLGANAVQVRPSGGVYFVMRERLSPIERLEELAGMMGITMSVVPLLDDGKQRDMLRKAFEADTIGEIDKTLTEIDKIMSGPKITTKRFAAMAKRRQELRELTEQYGRLLEDNLNGVELRLRAYDNHMQKLFHHTKG